MPATTHTFLTNLDAGRAHAMATPNPLDHAAVTQHEPQVYGRRPAAHECLHCRLT